MLTLYVKLSKKKTTNWVKWKLLENWSQLQKEERKKTKKKKKKHMEMFQLSAGEFQKPPPAGKPCYFVTELEFSEWLQS